MYEVRGWILPTCGVPDPWLLGHEFLASALGPKTRSTRAADRVDESDAQAASDTEVVDEGVVLLEILGADDVETGVQVEATQQVVAQVGFGLLETKRLDRIQNVHGQVAHVVLT